MGALNSLATLGLNLALGQQAQQAQGKELRRERDRQIRDIQLRDAQAQRQQDATLRRRLAEERARAGAAGVGGTGGSADAVLRGLTEESQLAGTARSQATARQIEELRRTYSQRRRDSLLDYAGRWLSSGGRSSRSLLD
jgi:hypothetical protein